ncbi:type I restriction endonuclease subunit R [Sorangium sp. So ce726]|uniref:type I restriction endonuclease subunit R n=1 Tax=Sorangium sp. So ce726 TaxID=3133319 RepID=UPI003F5D8DE7
MSANTRESHIEQAAAGLFRAMGWSTAYAMEEVLGERGTLGREHQGEVVLRPRLRAALEKLNPEAPPEALAQAIDELTRDRSAMSLVQANREIYELLKKGIVVRAGAADEEGEGDLRVRVIDWEEPGKNDFLAVQQFWVQGEMHRRRADLVGFVNGMPLVFLELKSLEHHVEEAFQKNFRDYLDTVPHLFWFNAVVLLSTGIVNRVGTITGSWDHFKEWKRIEREDEPRRVSLEVLLRGICGKRRLLDLVENFTLFSEQRSGVAKIFAQNHQYLGVTGAIEAVRRRDRDSRLGVVWHTQGSGKSFSMVFFSQKILRKLPGNWTFVVVTDREDLDAQIYKAFAGCEAVSPPGRSKKGEGAQGAQAKSAEHLKQLLQEDHRYVFTLIHKFRTDVKGAKYPKLSNRSDIIVIADEAHRTQYDTFAMNLRSALPNAAFIGFTGTPLMAGEEKTREVFGDYVSVYNFRQAIEDNATVPLYYEARVSELALSNEDLADDLADLLDEADLNEEQQKKVEREFKKQYQWLTGEERLTTLGSDVVTHLLAMPRGTKAMVVSIDKLTAVRMYDKVKATWAARLAEAKARLANTPYDDVAARAALEEKIAYLGETDMAVVVSQSQNEVDTFRKKGLDIAPHRRRMLKEDLDTRFKDGEDKLRIVFVCAMWMTGFDVPSCGVIYLDKPMKDHTLMQTIARANRVYKGKQSGIIVDYVGVFRNLKKALKIYGADSGGGVHAGDMPVQPKEVLVKELGTAIEEARRLCTARGVDLEEVKGLKGTLRRLGWLQDGVDRLVHPAEEKRAFLELASRVDRLYRAIGLSRRKEAFAAEWAALTDLARGLHGMEEPVDVSHVMQRVERLLDASITTRGPTMLDVREKTLPIGERFHLGAIDFDALAQYFARAKRKATVAAAASVAARVQTETLVRLNPTRKYLGEQLERLIADYNAGARNVEQFFEDLLTFMKKLEAEDARAEHEGLSREEFALFDLLAAGAVKLNVNERDVVKTIARELPKKLAPKLVIDWRKRQRARAAVKVTIERELEALPEETYSTDMYEMLVGAVYEHVYESYWGEGKSKYSDAAT